MITLYQFPPMWGLPNVSPFCMKVETYLRMANIPYQSKYVRNPTKAPKGKLPYIEDGDEVISDSSFIINYLKQKYGDALDRNLTPLQNAEKLAMQRLMEEHLYWIILYFRWIDPRTWDDVKNAFFGKLPFYLKWYIPNKVRNYMQQQLYFQGMGRNTTDEVFELGAADLKDITIFMGGNKFIFEDQPTSLDATAYAFLANIIEAPLEIPLKKHALEMKNLVEYCRRMKQQYYS